MKLSSFAVLLAACLAQAKFNSVFALLKTMGLTVQFECALPCLLEAANNIPPSEGLGAVDIICGNINEIAEATKPCTEKCEAKRASDFVTELTKYVCGHAPSAKTKRAAVEDVPAEEQPVVREAPAEAPSGGEPAVEQPAVEEPTAAKEEL